MVNYKYGLKKTTIDKIQTVLLAHPAIEKALIYGSRAMGNYREGSDIDLTLVGEQLTYTELSRIETALDALMLPYGIDLSLLHHIDNPELIEHIQQEGQVFYRSSHR